MSKQTITAIYFVLTFLAGAAVGSWTLWVYLMGGAAADATVEQAAQAPAAAAAPAETTQKFAPAAEPAPAGATASPPASPAAASAASNPADSPAASPASPSVPTPAPQPAAAAPAPDVAAPAPGPTPRGHWSKIDVPGRSHEECLALTRELNDAYKDCRFGTQTQVWVAE